MEVCEYMENDCEQNENENVRGRSFDSAYSRTRNSTTSKTGISPFIKRVPKTNIKRKGGI